MSYMLKHLATIYFRDMIHSKDGDSFQSLVNQLMTMKHNSKFTPIKPSGRYGDKKNDGYLSGNGLYFQVYGPEDLRKKATTNYAAKKFDEDFNTLLEHIDAGIWGDISEFHYIINDKFTGIPAPVASKKEELKKKYPSIGIEIIGSLQLQCYFSDLDLTKQQIILGQPLILDDNGIQFVEANALTKTINAIMNHESCEEDTPPATTLAKVKEKIQFNNLSEKIASVINLRLYELSLVESLISVSVPNTEAVLSNHFKKLYAHAKQIAENEDQMFLFIENETIELVLKENQNGATRKAVRAAVQSLMSLFFECCDIFEKPPAEEH
ncbi:hypothetical protein SANA_23230 [Gottschalkiaceae bacterium SANA]|nr:hypothetical protein SANA_23230 [Gottschalkiaceae bacterium SANA]